MTAGSEIQIASGAVVKVSGITVAGTGGLTGIDDNGGSLAATGVTITRFLTGVSVENKGTATLSQSA